MAASIQDLQSLTERGFTLFPCRPRSKHPAIPGWPDAATCDMSRIATWAEEHEDCNWGIATGAKSGIFVLDVDRKPPSNGETAIDGFAAVAEWSAEHLDTNWLRTASIRTAHGTHLLFAYPQEREISCSVGALAPGIDVRGWHGFVMAPGSIHPDGPIYKWANDEPIRPAPGWLLEKIRLADTRSTAANDAARNISGNQEAKIKCGCRNTTFASLAGAMRRRGVGRAAIEAALLVVNRDQCEVPLSESEVRSIAQSVSRYKPDPPASHPSANSSPPRTNISKAEHIPDPRALARDRVRFLVEDLIPLNAVTIIAGEYSVGKSWLALVLASELKKGGAFIGREVVRCAEVLYFDRENPLSVIQERMDVLYRDGEQAHRHWGLWCDDEPPLLDHSLLLGFAHPGAVLIFDTLVRFHSADENSPSQMAKVMACLRRLQSRGAAVIALHHRDKALTAGYRGTAEIPAGCDVLFSLAKDEGKLVLRALKSRVQVDELVTFTADWDAARLVPSQLNSVMAKRAIIDEIRDRIRRDPGISQSAIAKAINATLVKKVSRWTIQQILDRHEGSLWRAERGPTGTRTGYFDLFSSVSKLPLPDHRPESVHQQVVSGGPAAPADGTPAGLAGKESIASGKPALAADCCQQVLTHEPAGLLPPDSGGQPAGGLAGEADADADEGTLI
jgi:hypothetical protein